MMNDGSRLPRQGGLRLNPDFAMGIVGCFLAAASASFGIFMTIHGPAADFGKSGDFTVFAQLAPRGTSVTEARPRANEELDMSATASIPHQAQAGPQSEFGDSTIITSVTLEAAQADVATVLVNGRARTIHVGDTIPGAGDVLAIVVGRHPAVKTSRGMILSARE